MPVRALGKLFTAARRLTLGTGFLAAWLLVAGGIGLLVWGQVSDPPASPLSNASDGSSIAVSMFRGGCHGSCPVYQVTILGSGKVEYQGHSHVLMEGRYSDRIPEESVDELRTAIELADFFSLEDSYGLCFDLEGVEVDIQIGRFRKTVRSSLGCYALPFEPRGVSKRERREVDRLGELHRTIDRLAGTERWVGTKEQRDQKIRAERDAAEVAREARIADLEARFDAGDPQEKRQIAVDLLRYDTRVEDALPIALQMLEDADDTARRKAASGIKAVIQKEPPPDQDLGASREEIVAALTAALGDSNRRVRGEAALALGWMGPEASPAAASIAVLLQDDEMSAQKSAFNALFQMGPHAAPAAQGVVEAFREAWDRERPRLIALLGSIGPRSATISLPVLAEALQDPDRTVRFQAARSLGKLGVAASSALELLTEAARSDPDERVRRAAREAIAALESP